eukprot:Partr_v1_DN24310_c0_g1_i2_m31858 putative Fat storage-inducing transmembrane protein
MNRTPSRTFTVLALFASMLTLSAVPDAWTQSVVPEFLFDNGNVLNKYFVKLGWAWTSAPIVALTLMQSRRSKISSGLMRIMLATLYWFIMVKWCFGASVFDRVFAAWPYASCDIPDRRIVAISSHQECVNSGWEWISFDISGHCFLLSHASLFIWEELFQHLKITSARQSFLGLKRALAGFSFGISMLWMFMLVITSLIFHTVHEKIIGLAFGTAYWFVTRTLFSQQ